MTQPPSSFGTDLIRAQLTSGPLATAAPHCTHRLSLLGVRALHAAAHLIFPWDLNQLLTTSPFPNCHGASAPSWRQPCTTCTQALQTGCCISRPRPAKPNILHLTKECKENLTNAEPRSRQLVPKLLCFSSKSELCWTSLTEASQKIFSGLTEKHAKIWQGTSKLYYGNSRSASILKLCTSCCLGDTNKPPEAEFKQQRLLYWIP